MIRKYHNHTQQTNPQRPPGGRATEHRKSIKEKQPYQISNIFSISGDRRVHFCNLAAILLCLRYALFKSKLNG